MAKQIAIELNDSGIIVCNEQQLLLDSPGYIIDLAGYEWIGKEARDRALLHPNECNHRFWYELARTKTKAINHNNTKLALRHLSSIWSQVSKNVDTVILTVPATFTNTGLGILLGICDELSIPVNAMVHHAALSPRQSNHSGDTVHVDVLLHHTAITFLREHQSEFKVEHTILLDDIGWHSFYTATAEYITQTFIKSTRLDPMHSASLEQQLFNRLPIWLASAQTEETIRCQIEHQNSLFEVNINSSELKNILNVQLSKIINSLSSREMAQPIIACVSTSVNEQLGFHQLANRYGILVRPLHIGHHAQQGLLHAEQLLDSDSQIYLNKQLPYTILTDPLPLPNNELSVTANLPTHILYRNRAFPLNDSLYLTGTTTTGFQLQLKQTDMKDELLSIRCNDSSVSVEIADGHEITVNNQMVQTHTRVTVGDRIHIANCEDDLVFIKVEE